MATTIYYLASLRLPTEKAYGVNMVKTCEALSEAGASVTLIAPYFRRQATRDLFDYYGIKRSFTVVFYPFLDVVSYCFSLGDYLKKRDWSKNTIFFPFLFCLAFLFDQLIFSLTILAAFLFRRRSGIIYTRSSLFLAWSLKILGYRVFYDLHGFPYHFQWWWRFGLSRLNGVTVTNQWKAERCRNFFGLSPRRILISPNGFDPVAFERKIDRQKIRAQFSSDPRRPVALYVGHFYDWKGAHVFAEAAKLLPKINCVFIGGTEADQQKFRQHYPWPNILIFGRRPHYQIPDYLRAADVLVQPNPGLAKEKRLAHFATYDTSPIKLFEYMASGVPMVATDLPSTREWLSEKNAVLIKPNDAQILAASLEWVLANPVQSQQLAAQAQKDVRQYSWFKRGRAILDFIQSS